MFKSAIMHDKLINEMKFNSNESTMLYMKSLKVLK